MSNTGKVPGQGASNAKQNVGGKYPTDPVQDPSSLAQLKKALAEGAPLGLLMLLVGKSNIEQKQTKMYDIEIELKKLQDIIKNLNAAASALQNFIKNHPKSKQRTTLSQKTIDYLEKYSGMTGEEIGQHLNTKGGQNVVLNDLNKTAGYVDQKAQRLTTQASQATQDFNSFVSLISSVMKSDKNARDGISRSY